MCLCRRPNRGWRPDTAAQQRFRPRTNEGHRSKRTLQLLKVAPLFGFGSRRSYNRNYVKKCIRLLPFRNPPCVMVRNVLAFRSRHFSPIGRQPRFRYFPLSKPRTQASRLPNILLSTKYRQSARLTFLFGLIRPPLRKVRKEVGSDGRLVPHKDVNLAASILSG